MLSPFATLAPITAPPVTSESVLLYTPNDAELSVYLTPFETGLYCGFNDLFVPPVNPENCAHVGAVADFKQSWLLFTILRKLLSSVSPEKIYIASKASERFSMPYPFFMYFTKLFNRVF